MTPTFGMLTMGRSAFYESPVVKIIVGDSDNQRTFHIHSDLLKQNSEYFKVCLNSQFREGRTKHVTLEDDDAEVFHLFVQWLYEGEYNVKKARSVENGGCEEMYYRFHAEAYALGNKLVAPGFKTYVVQKLVRVLERYDEVSMTTLLEMTETVYRGTSEEDVNEMRVVLATYCASRMGKDHPRARFRLRGTPWNFSIDELAELAQADQTCFLKDVLL